MRQSEKQLREILKQNIEISDIVNNRLKETYDTLAEGERIQEKKSCYRRNGRNLRTAAAVVIILCTVLPGAAYASVKSGFFDAMFGNATKKSTPVQHRNIDDGKEGTVDVIIPSREYVPVDEGKARKLLGDSVAGEPIVKTIGSHVLTIENCVYDKNSALVYFTLERPGGVTALKGDDETNLDKGAYFTDEADFFFCFESKKGIMGGENIYIDTEKSTSEKLYCYTHVLWNESLKKGDIPQMALTTYPCTSRELNRMNDEQMKKIAPDIKEERISLTDKEPVSVASIDMGKEGYLEYSPISVSIDMSKGMGLSEEEAMDPYYMKSLEIKYKDGGKYIVYDEEKEIDNSSYTLGAGTWYKTAFNRLVDVDEIAEIRVNDVIFSK